MSSILKTSIRTVIEKNILIMKFEYGKQGDLSVGLNKKIQYLFVHHLSTDM